MHSVDRTKRDGKPGPASTDTEFFFAKGYLRLPAFHPKARLERIRKRLLDETKSLFAAQGVSRSIRKLPVFQQIGKLSDLVSAQGVHQVLVTAELTGLVTQLAGRAPSRVQDANLLLSPPNQGTWTLDGLNWHVDLSAERRDGIPGIQAFFLIDDVAPHGGATLALAGSHLVDTRPKGPGAGMREALRGGATLETKLQDFGVDIFEMSGRAGDVYLMDMRVLHTPSINATKNVRLMATCRFLFDT